MAVDHRVRDDNPRVVVSNQDTIHRDLVAVVRKHEESRYRRPIAAHNKMLFQRLGRIVGRRGDPLIFDSGCGDGESTRRLALRYPNHLVIGIDKSRARLARGRAMAPLDNLLLVHGDCIDLWRLALAAGWTVEQHYLLYPNPWPKAKHLRRRWHGHPVFGCLVALGGLLEVRTNWENYVAEFALALATIGAGEAGVERMIVEDPLTPFERKYLAGGHALYRLSTRLPTGGASLPVEALSDPFNGGRAVEDREREEPR